MSESESQTAVRTAFQPVRFIQVLQLFLSVFIRQTMICSFFENEEKNL